MLADDGLERELKFFSRLSDRVCTTCAPEDQEKSCDSQCEEALLRSSGRFRVTRLLEGAEEAPLQKRLDTPSKSRPLSLGNRLVVSMLSKPMTCAG